MDKERLTLEIPYGMRDFLPVEAAEKRAIETELALMCQDEADAREMQQTKGYESLVYLA